MRPFARTDLSTPITIKMSLFSDGSLAPGTDPWMACNVYVKTAQTGVLRNTPREFVKGDPLGPVAPVADMLSATVAGALAAEKREIVEAIGRSLFGRQPPPVVVRPPRPMAFGVPVETLSIREQQLDGMTEKSRTLGYKARPLTGIWATPPYLHNGSVPTLYDLLLPAESAPAGLDRVAQVQPEGGRLRHRRAPRTTPSCSGRATRAATSSTATRTPATDTGRWTSPATMPPPKPTAVPSRST